MEDVGIELLICSENISISRKGYVDVNTQTIEIPQCAHPLKANYCLEIHNVNMAHLTGTNQLIR